MDNLLVNRVNRHRRRRNLPAELKVEIVDCLPLENAAHFLANVPNRLIIHHCAPRIRAMMPKMIDQIVIGFARTLRATDSNRNIWLENGHNYTPEIDIFIRYCSAHCDSFGIFRGAIDGLVGYPANFFDDLIKYFHETKVPGKVVRHLNIDLPFENPAPWPAALVQTEAGKIKLEEMDVIGKKFVFSILRNKHNPGIAFKVFIFSEGGAKCYQQMTRFGMIMDG